MTAIILSQSDEKTMSSKEIAARTGKRHTDVIRDVRVMLKQLDDANLLHDEYQEVKDTRGYTEEFLLSKKLCLNLAAGYSAPLRMTIINRWEELETQLHQSAPALPNFADPVAAARAWADEYEAKQIALSQVAILEPKAQALDTIADTENTYTIRECAKTIGIKEKDLIDLLLSKKWCYRDEAKRLQPYAEKVSSGVFINRASPVIKNNHDGQERVFLHMRITAFGLTRITGLVNKQRGNAA